MSLAGAGSSDHGLGVRPWIGIAALARNRVIGHQGRIPWHLPADFAWFKRVTAGQILVMGRKTFESIGRPLPGRRTLVFSRSGFHHEGVETVFDLASLSARLAADPRLVFICGGGEIYRELLPRCSDLFLTWVHRDADGDATFPAFEERFEPLAEIASHPDFHITHYVRRVTAG